MQHASASAAQKQQRAIVAELRSLVPGAAAALLAAPLLEAGFVRLPVADAAGPAADTPQIDSAASTAAANHLHGWQACMAMLQQEYPALPGLLLEGSVTALASAGTPAPAQSMAWLQLLLQHAVPTDNSTAAVPGHLSNGSTSQHQNNPAFAWQPTQAQVLQLVAACINAQQGSGAAQPAPGAEQPAAILVHAALSLLQHVDSQSPYSTAHTVAGDPALQVKRQH